MSAVDGGDPPLRSARGRGQRAHQVADRGDHFAARAQISYHPGGRAQVGYSCKWISRLASRKPPSIITASATSAASTHSFEGAVRAVCHTSAPSAARQATVPAAESQRRLWVFGACRALAALTAAKIKRNPALPTME